MARLTNGFHHLSMKRACVNIRPLIRARATGSEMITIEKGKERQGFAAYTSFSKHYQDLYEKMGVVRLSSPLHTSCERLLAEKSRNIVDESKVEEKSKLIDNTTEKHSDGNSKGTQPPLPEARNPVSWLSLGLMVMTGAGLIFYFDQEKKRLVDASRQGSIESKPGPGAGKAAIGGPFKLINHEGKEITNEDLKGNWALLYFGFTHCPDICPDELQKMVEAIDVIEKRDSLQITPVFISIDPERDNVEQIREYVKEFHPRLVGLTGNLDEIRQVARAYRVYYMKTEEDGSDYLVDHSIIMYLMDPKMEFVKFFGKNYDVNGLADGIIDEIKRYK